MGEIQEMEPYDPSDGHLELLQLQPKIVIEMKGGGGFVGCFSGRVPEFSMHKQLDGMVLLIISTSSDAILRGVPVRGVMIARVLEYGRGSCRTTKEVVLISLYGGGEARRLRAVELMLSR